jgi:hypothetical protein
MSVIASATRSTTGRALVAALRLSSALSLAVLCLLTLRAQAQVLTPPPEKTFLFDKPADLGFTYTQERTKIVGGSPHDYFHLRGATVDYAYTLWHGVGVDFAGQGLAITNLESQIDIRQITILAGPRYTLNYGHITPTAWGRHTGIFGEGKIGYTFATSGLYPVNGVLQNHASGLTYQAGGGVNVHIYHRFDLRLFEADYVLTKLPNGTNNEQRTLRLATGINFHFGN